MFCSCSKLTSIIGIEKFNPSNAEDIDGMFVGCTSLTKLDLSKWRLTKCKLARKVFRNCSGLKELNLKGFVFNEGTYLNSMFSGCSNLEHVYVKYYPDCRNCIVAGDNDGVFRDCTKLPNYTTEKDARGYSV